MSNTDYKKLVPLRKVVAAALLDSYEDKSRGEELYYHFAARGLKKLQGEVLKQGKRSVLLTVNKNTHTATLPTDFSEALFVGVLDARGVKFPLFTNNSLANRHNVEVIEPTESCSICGQSTSICEDLQISEEVTIVKLDETHTGELRVIKRLYPNGDYYLETKRPYLDLTSGEVAYNTEKEFIDHLDLKSCGCIETSEANMSVLQRAAPDAYCRYYAPCECSNPEFGSYRIFEESGLIQFDYNFQFDKVYLEYTGFIPKVNGQFQVPEVAFETLVEWTKYKSIQNRKNISRLEKQDYFNSYRRERDNMTKILGRISLSAIIDISTRVPQLRTSYRNWYSAFDWGSAVANAIPASASGNGVASNGTGGNGGGGGGSTSTTVTITNNVENDKIPSVIVNGISFNSEGTYLNGIYKNRDLLIFWNGIRYLTRNEYILAPNPGGATILLNGGKFTSEDNFIFIDNGKLPQ